jgi:2-polyprenyl-3-methyl-5-hydroxy-6-metoxy-1,4-benzoquinol methylase
MSDKIYTESNSDYLRKNPTWHVEDSPWKAKQILTILSRNNIQPKSITELGCGAGEILVQLCSQMPESTFFTGYEISPDAYDMCQSRAHERLLFKKEDLLSQEDVSDLLLVIDVFEHVEDYITFIRKCQSRAKYKIFHIPLDISVQSVLRNAIMTGRRNFGHLHYFTKETALATLEDNGYKIIDHFYTAVGLDLPRTFKSKIAYLPRLLLNKLNKGFAARLLGGYSLLVIAE